jgi:hypothetical protein
VPQIPLDFLDVSASGNAAFALEVESGPFVQALKRISTQPKRADWVHLQYRLGLLVISSGETSVQLRAAGSWPQVTSVARSWVPALLKYPLPADVTSLRVENGKLFVQDLGVACIAGADPKDNEEIAERQRHVTAAAAALAKYSVGPQEIEDLLREADPEVARLWGPNDDKTARDVAMAWQCLASYGVEPSAIRRLLIRKSRDLWKDSGRVRG